MKKNTSKILVVSGEISGDQYAALLALRLKQRLPDLEIAGIGGEKLTSTGVRIIVKNPISGNYGITAVLKNFGPYVKFLKQCVNTIQKENPDLIIFIDNPGFRKIYYIPPKIWAHNYQRIFLIKEIFEAVITIFPFEKDIYDKENIPAYCFGHPVFDLIDESRNSENVSQKIPVNGNNPLVGMFPGSRAEEIKYIMPLLIKAGQEIKKRYPSVDFIVSCADERLYETLQTILKSSGVNWPIWKGSAHRLAEKSRVALTASGTMNLEIAILGVPMIVFYRMNIINYIIAKTIVHCRYVSPVNIFAGKKIVEEFIQQVNWPKFSRIFSEIFEQGEKRQRCIELLQQSYAASVYKDVNGNVADFILGRLHENNKRIS
ncbi:MAG TPA: lipid-A-disaccharide synthase [bacterium]|nr:lipid-A-disaccharide synthase [bacterium]